MMACSKTYFSVFFLILFLTPQIHAAPTEEETDAFFTQQRKDKAAFDHSIVAETDSRTAATQEFYQKMQAERAAFQNTMPDRPSTADLQRFDDFNAAQRQKQASFQKSLATLPKSKFEQTLIDFDAKAIADRNALNESLAGQGAEAQSETIRQYQNDQLQKRAQLKNATLNEIAKRQKQFKEDQAQKVHDFFGS